MAQQESWISLRQGVPVDEAAIPRVSPAELAIHMASARDVDGRLAQLFGRRLAGGSVRLYGLVAYDQDGEFRAIAADLPAGQLSYPSVTALWPAAQAFEREIAEQFGVTPVGHPWLKPLRYHDTDDGSPQPWGKFDPGKVIPGDYNFYRVEGEEVHEVAVGPVHAGIIEPGHFRFQCHGEDVLHLEIVLGYQHRAAEPLLLHPNSTRSAIVAETIAGDTSIGHATAYCKALEGLAGAAVTGRAAMIRGVALEMERLANHTGDLGALCMDIGFLPGASYLGRIRGDFLNLTAEICGNRFGRNLVRPGGVMVDIPDEMASRLLERLGTIAPDVLGVLEMMFAEPSVLARFEGTGVLSLQQAEELGLVGPVGRACGCARDVRNDHPCGVDQFTHIPMAVDSTGDVHARAVVRWVEVQRSLSFLRDVLGNLPQGSTRQELGPMRPSAMAIGLAEGWRGETLHVAFTDERAQVCFVKAKDPSIHNWFGLAQALRNVAISDFPICNKSFSLSYCGHDL